MILSAKIGVLEFDDTVVRVVGTGGASDYATIQAAVNAVQDDGETIFILNGSYTEQVIKEFDKTNK